MRVRAPDQPIRIATTATVFWVRPGHPRDLDGDLLRAAYDAGCVRDEDSVSSKPAVVVDESPITAERFLLVRTAIEELIARNDPEAFTMFGVPKVREVASVLGDQVTRKEVEDVFAMMSESSDDDGLS